MAAFVEIQKIHYSNCCDNRRLNLPALFVLPFLWVASVFYSLVISLKNFLYNCRLLKETKVGARVICVGNLTTGGVGKTPVVCEIAKYLREQGKRVAVLSRGYGGELDNKNVNVVKNFDTLLVDDAKLCGDEPCLIAQNTAGVAVLTCKDRVKSAKYAIENLGAEILLMDDGFSNRKIFKDLNILLVDNKKFFGNKKLLPLGPLREPLSEIKRAQKVLVINKGVAKSEAKGTEILPKIVHSVCDMKIAGIINPKTGDTLAADADGGKIFAFCAIGSPEQFYEYLKPNYELAGTKTFPDHYCYSQDDLTEMCTAAKLANASYIITTEKDYVKIQGFVGAENIHVLKLALNLNVKELLS